MCLHEYKPHGESLKIKYGFNGERKLIYKAKCSKCGKEITRAYFGGYVGELFHD